MSAILFERERIARCRAALARDLAASAPDRKDRRRFLDESRQCARTLPGSRYESTLIRG